MDLTQFIEGLNRKKKGCIREKILSLCLSIFQLGHWSFLAFGLGLNWNLHRVSPDSQVFGLRLEIYCQLSCVSSFPTAGLGLLSLHYHVSQSLIVQNPSLSAYVSVYRIYMYVFCFFGDSRLVQQGCKLKMINIYIALSQAL